MINKNISESITDISQRKAARIAGVLYFLNALFAILGIMASMDLIVPGDAAQTANNIIASKEAYQFAFMSNVMMMLVGVFLPLALYIVLKPVSESYSTLFVLLMLISVPIMCINLVNQFAALHLLSGEFSSTFNTDQLNALVVLFLDLEEIGYSIAKIFFGIWLFPLGYLVYKSGYFPRILGILLIIGCFGYLIDFTMYFLVPGSADFAMLVMLPVMICEMAFTFWLLLKGANIPEN